MKFFNLSLHLLLLVCFFSGNSFAEFAFQATITDVENFEGVNRLDTMTIVIPDEEIFFQQETSEWISLGRPKLVVKGVETFLNHPMYDGVVLETDRGAEEFIETQFSWMGFEVTSRIIEIRSAVDVLAGPDGNSLGVIKVFMSIYLTEAVAELDNPIGDNTADFFEVLDRIDSLPRGQGVFVSGFLEVDVEEFVEFDIRRGRYEFQLNSDKQGEFR